ncbi:MAG TPA: 2-amino-4-oxopentanoate thiolase subunit OrtB [Bacilli bacterium]|jgi:cysteine synthase|nr:PLP-dependent lyase/thiolase [Acholeplasmataceae bacterium]OQB62393.1 MAG: Tryptophan synthase beta chain [Tenericutes bacterium ADurb.Bin140]HOE77572.1 2-amino-4-oxopentanoate thiolase subunit OrtB [Bacilli bacterium]HON63937.1 2-amino-4-oxopentanoate thiolase subunit OrtB [Bacilli bacterium]HOR96252.1 2-amino-4-oxopentanoate thiolase subunit OrtB [Bacilli bacterium]
MTDRYSYESIIKRKAEIMRQSTGIDYSKYEKGLFSFDYEGFMNEYSIPLDLVKQIQAEHGVGQTPLKELKNITALVRKIAKPGNGARIFLKDEACNDSGSFKARRASLACFLAKALGFKGVITATSGNYGAAVASQAAKYGLKCIVVQECFDSRGIGQPEIIEKARACEAYGAEVVQLSVGPELFYVFLRLIEETGYYNASLYSPFAVNGIETLGMEIVEDCLRLTQRVPDVVVVTNAGGGNLTGTVRGIKKATDQKVQIVASSVNLAGLHMASDHDFNRKSFTTGHTGFGIPFTTYPDRSDVPRSAARPLRYMDRYVTVNQGEVFFMTETLSVLEGLERGPAGNTALTAAFSIAQELPEDEIIVVQESEYTGAGKHHQAQLSFARENGIDIFFGNPREEIPGTNIILPDKLTDIVAQDLDLRKIRTSLIRNYLKGYSKITNADLNFLKEETNTSLDEVKDILRELKIEWEDANG